MATITVGQILNGTSARLQAHQKDVLNYLIIFIPVTAVASFLDASLGLTNGSGNGGMERDWGLFGIVAMVASVIFQYRLFAAMLGRAPDSGRYAAFVGLAFLTFLGVGLATVALVIPGLIVGARWLMSPAIFAGEGVGAVDSLRESWKRTTGNTTQVALAIVVWLLAAIVLAAVIGGIGLLFGGVVLVTSLVNAVAGELSSVALIGLSLAVYDLLGGKQDLGTVFE